MSDTQNTKELGLIDIFQVFGKWIVSGIKTLVNWFLYLFFFGFKRWKTFVAVIFLIGLYTVVTYKMQDAQYEASMILRSNAMPTAQMKPFLDNYNSLLQSRLLSDSSITVKSSLDSVQRSLISSINVYYCMDQDRDGIMDEVDLAGRLKTSDENLDSLNLCVKVRFEDVRVLDDVVTSLTSYVNSLPYVQRMNKARLLQQNKRKLFIQNEIRLLDTIQQKAYGESEEASSYINRGGVIVDNRKVLSIYEDKVDLMNLYEVLEREMLIFSDPITVVEDFVIQKSALNTLTSMLKKNLIIGVFVVYVFLFLFFFIYKEKDNYLTKS